MTSMARYLIILLIAVMLSSHATAFEKGLQSFFEQHCYDCHDDEVKKADFDLTVLSTDLSDAATLAKWIQVFDRVQQGEMPPAKKKQPTIAEKVAFAKGLGPALTIAHQKQKGTVLRRLNRHEYENTLNDLFGTDTRLAGLLPEDGRSHEFDVVGEALGISMTHLRKYLDGANAVLDEATAKWTTEPKPKVKTASYATGRDKGFVGKHWGKAPDGAVVFYRKLGYPTGMLREANFDKRGWYKVRVTGYAYQSNEPITFFLGSSSFQRGAEKPVFGYYQMHPGTPQTVEVEIFSEAHYMVVVEPMGIRDRDDFIKKRGIESYAGPGLAISKIEIEGPLHKEWPKRGHHLLFDGVARTEIEPWHPKEKAKPWYKPKFEVKTDDPVASATSALARLGSVAFRRPVSAVEIEPYVELFKAEMADGATYEPALKVAVSAILASPRFLYLQEPKGRLDDYALAARLSYFLARTTPDDELLRAAKSGELSKSPEALRRQAARLLKDVRFERFVTDFTDSWLNLREIEFTSPDRSLFPEFDRYLQDSMVAETREYFATMVQENLPVRHVVQSDFTIANERLAEHYDLEGVTGPVYRKVSLPKDSVRGGFLAHASVHKVSANGNNTSPVFRGVWVLERILGQPPAPPPPGIPGVEPDIRGATTLREKLDKHRNMESCNSCHQKIDPPGFAMEVFNPIGGYRDYFRSLGVGDKIPREETGGMHVRYRKGPVVDASSQLPDGRKFEDFVSFREHLAKDERTLARALTSKLLTFASGREMGFSDREEIERIVDAVAKKGYGVQDIVYEVIGSEIFCSK
jgi:hypothetical protein